MKQWIVLIRGIIGVTHKKMSMQQLREAATAAGLENVSTYIASGNLLFQSDKTKTALKKILVKILADHGLTNDIFFRTPSELKAILKNNPFPDAAEQRPNHLLVLFLEKAPAEEGVKTLQQGDGSERIVANNGELYIDYIKGVGDSKLTPTLIDRTLGQPGTARNLNTISKLIERCA